ncbi:hypothetical protein LQ327_06290 [Actinomycetospora endophytica]|uniref:Hsp70 protein n=1 Tax=Actinomycetospora endophytica TaxID=2291215 RepID=A0ABS8P4Z0_9PSEU|nr:hypothetical protein [Actinomycetospora endophytica]MCD2192997.1 hypothetical protein [Actinomycetospora endophytica]
MSSWVMAVEVTPSELVAVDVDRSTGGGSLRARRVPLDTDTDGADPVDVLADAFARVVEGSTAPPDRGEVPERPTRLVIATPPDTERRRFEEIAEATALVGLPAPAWLPAPVALVGDRISAEVEVGGQSVVLDARAGGLTAWPVRRTSSGAEIGSRGPVATGTRLDQLLLDVVRAQLSSLDPAVAASDGPSPGSRKPGEARDLRGEAARLRREIRRARSQLASGEAEEARVAAEAHEVVLERAVFDQLVEHALEETLGEITDGPDEARRPVVHVLGDRSTPLARRLVDLTAGPERAAEALVLPGASHDGVLGLAALLLPPRTRAARAASGAQAIRAARTVGTSPTPVGASAVGAPAMGVGGGSGIGGSGAGGSGPDDGDGPGPDDGLLTPETGLPVADGHGDGERDTAIPEARLPSSPVQAQRRGPNAGAGVGAADDLAAHGLVSGGPGDRVAAADDRASGEPAAEDRAPGEPAPAPGDHHPGGPVAPGDHRPDPAQNGHVEGDPQADHLALVGAVPHEVRPAGDAPPGGRSPAGALQGQPEAAPAPAGGDQPRGAVRGRRGPDTAPQPVPEADPRAGKAPRGAVPVLIVLVVLAVLAAVGVLLVGPDQIDTAFAGLGAGTGFLPLDLWTVSR